jgi:nucleoside-diphosphate-sugar epimerase
MGVVGYESTQKNFLYSVVSSLSLGKKLAVAVDQKGNLTCATDLARGIAMLLEADKRGIYHVAGIDPYLRRIDVARKIAYQYGLDKSLLLPVLTPALTQKAQRPANAGLSIHKIRKELRFIPKVRLPSPNEILPDLRAKI